MPFGRSYQKTSSHPSFQHQCPHRITSGKLAGYTYYEGATKRDLPLDKVLH